MSGVASPPPEQGQIVNVRSRNWMVTDVSTSTLAPPALKPAFHDVRWHKVAEWLRAHSSADPVAKFLLRQFTDFLEAQRIAVSQVGKEYLVGIEVFLRLVTMLEKAIQDCGLGFARSYQCESGGKRWWTGGNVIGQSGSFCDQGGV
jgi:hypothetical protein